MFWYLRLYVTNGKQNTWTDRFDVLMIYLYMKFWYVSVVWNLDFATIQKDVLVIFVGIFYCVLLMKYEQILKFLIIYFYACVLKSN